jgi:hypothetical protein
MPQANPSRHDRTAAHSAGAAPPTATSRRHRVEPNHAQHSELRPEVAHRLRPGDRELEANEFLKRAELGYLITTE